MKPTSQVPNLHLPLINGTAWSLHGQHPDSFTLLVFYRGYHCPVCKKQLQEVTSHLTELTQRGVYVTAIPMDTEERAKKSANDWELKDLPVAHTLSEEEARSFGLYISHAISDREPDVFSEPGMFLVKPDNSLYFSSIQNAPFTRPAMNDLIKAIDFIKDKDYPARGSH